jgi:hypothetical protein
MLRSHRDSSFVQREARPYSNLVERTSEIDVATYRAALGSLKASRRAIRFNLYRSNHIG